MTRKFALKRLTASDLTLFEWQFRNRNAGNQKAINLNADVFVGILYPSLAAIAKTMDNKLSLDLWVVGPGAGLPINLQRKIIKGSAYKNWRLDGEYISDPPDEPDRYNALNPSDLALMAFEGDLAPSSATIILVAKSVPEDAGLFAEFDRVLGDARMVALDEETVSEICDQAKLSSDHPLRGLTTDEDLRDAATGNAAATERILRRGRAPRLSASALKNAREAADEIGQLGEALVDVYLGHKAETGEISSYKWISAWNAISPFDFEFQVSDDLVRLDVKTTTGPFDRECHVSLSELREMACGDCPYHIYRVYDATQEGAILRVAENMKSFAQEILDAFGSLPLNVTPDGVSIKPDPSSFGDEIALHLAADDE